MYKLYQTLCLITYPLNNKQMHQTQCGVKSVEYGEVCEFEPMTSSHIVGRLNQYINGATCYGH